MNFVDPGESVVDFTRDQWGRPLIVPRDGGRAKPYTRASSAAKTIEDTYNLEMWARRNVAFGLAHDASLVARILAIGGDPVDVDATGEAQVGKVVTDAEAVAKAHKAADIGTAVHRLTERLDLGEEVHAGPYEADLEAYTNALIQAGLTVDKRYVECRLVCDELEMAGTADRLLANGDGYIVADLKTSASVAYGGLGWAAQLAAYAHSELYDVTTNQRIHTPTLDAERGIIIHLPAGEGCCTLYDIDLTAGYEAAKLANTIRATRKASKTWIMPLTTAKVDPPVDRRDALRQRYALLDDAGKVRFQEIAPDPNDLDAVEAALEQADVFTSTVIPPPTVEVPETPPERPTLPDNPAEGEGVHDKAFDGLQDAYKALDDEQKQWVVGIVDEAREALVPFHAHKSTGKRTARRFDIYRGLIALARAGHTDGDLVRDIVATVWDSDAARFPTFTVGHVVGAMHCDEAAQFADLALAVAEDVTAVDLRPQPTAA